jgi:hypothetical protein
MSSGSKEELCFVHLLQTIAKKTRKQFQTITKSTVNTEPTPGILIVN